MYSSACRYIGRYIQVTGLRVDEINETHRTWVFRNNIFSADVYRRHNITTMPARGHPTRIIRTTEIWFIISRHESRTNQLIGYNVIIRHDGSNFSQAILCMLIKSLYNHHIQGREVMYRSKHQQYNIYNNMHKTKAKYEKNI